ncbi:hypothetical protein Bsel_2629 [[Bacillus] selenitireducens MLS10]|uniref:Uncharacterized protein n=1 Tax=Bacillus selenitireducens (strain ATCC 700615 / DSM 15326 / MLS10) TaxID=439292 RepID=D6XXT6_BACIE|nr:hypothetical protein Bsel_2629 [[Bacillus] selenitireducens MLS10]
MPYWLYGEPFRVIKKQGNMPCFLINKQIQNVPVIMVGTYFFSRIPFR